MMIRRSNSLISSSFLNYPVTKKIIRILEEDYSIDPDDYSEILKTVDRYLKSINSSRKIVKPSIDEDFYKDDYSNFEEDEIESSVDMNEDNFEEEFDKFGEDIDTESLNSTVDLIKQNYPCYANGTVEQIAQDFSLSDKEASYVLSQLKEISINNNQDKIENKLIKDKYAIHFTMSDGYSDSINCSSKQGVEREINGLLEDDNLSEYDIYDFNTGISYDSLNEFKQQKKLTRSSSKKESDPKKKSKYNGCNVTGREAGMAPQAEAPSGGLF